MTCAIGCIQSSGKNADCHMHTYSFFLVERKRPNEINDVISTEIPDNDEDLLLHETVTKNDK